MIVDALVVAGPNLFLPTTSLADVVRSSGSHGVDAIVAAPGRPFDYGLPPANDNLAAESEAHDNVARLGRVDPLQGAQAAAEARRCLVELHCAGLFLHPGEEYFRLSRTTEVVRVAASLGAPVVIAAGLSSLSEPLQFLDLARAVPDAQIVMTSGGQINISGLSMIDAWTALTGAPNLRVMTNGTYRQDFLERIVNELGPERLMFGSFSPYYEQDFELARIENVGMDDVGRSLVEGDNARRMFHL